MKALRLWLHDATAIQYLGSHHPTRTCINGHVADDSKNERRSSKLSSVHMHATPWTIRICSLLILVQRLGIHLLSQSCSMRSGCCYYPPPLAEMNFLTKMLLRKMPRQLLWYSDWMIDWTMQRWQHWAMIGRQAAKLSQTHEKLGV